MSKFYYIIHYPNGDYNSLEEESDSYGGDGTFDSYEEAQEAASYDISCHNQGGEILNLSNPGDYDYNGNEDFDVDIEEVEI